MKQINSTFYPLGSDLIDFGYRKVCYGTILWNFHWLIHFALANNKLSMTYKYIAPKNRQDKSRQDLNNNIWRDVTQCFFYQLQW